MDVDWVTLGVIYVLVKTVEVHVIVKVVNKRNGQKQNDKRGHSCDGIDFGDILQRVFK